MVLFFGGGADPPTGEDNFGIILAIQSIGNLRCSRRCSVAVAATLADKRDHSIANNISCSRRDHSDSVCQASANRNPENSERRRTRLIGRQASDGSAQRGRSLISTTALLSLAPFTRYNVLSNRLSNRFCQAGCQTGLTTGCIVCTNIQPVVKPVWQPV